MRRFDMLQREGEYIGKGTARPSAGNRRDQPKSIGRRKFIEILAAARLLQQPAGTPGTSHMEVGGLNTTL